MKLWFAFLAFLGLFALASQCHALNVNAACPITTGTLKPAVTLSRTTGVSDLAVWFDATATVDAAVPLSPFQDVTYVWDFGDRGASGTGTWSYGMKGAKGSATGPVAFHLFHTEGRDTKYTWRLQVYDNYGNSAVCGGGLTAYDPTTSNGFPGANTTCAAATSTPVAGSGGCPPGAGVLQQASYNTAISSKGGSGKRVLFHCGDTFTGDHALLSGTNWAVGAYGGCEGTQTNRPIIRDSGTTGQFEVAHGDNDGRIADLDFQGGGVTNSSGTVTTPYAGYAVQQLGSGADATAITLSNLNSSGNGQSYLWSAGAHWAIVNSTMSEMQAIGVFANYAGDNPPGDVSGTALIGNSFNGLNAPNTSGVGNEVLRLSACNICVISSNTISNANNVGALTKIHNKNTFGGNTTWVGGYAQNIEISDNLFSGKSGTQSVELSPQNASDDERLRNIIFERNLIEPSSAGLGGKVLVSAVNVTLRLNAVYVAPGLTAPYYGIQVAKRGIEPTPSGVEVYSNTFYGTEFAVGFDGQFYSGTGPSSSFAANNLYYNWTTNNWATVIDKGTSDTVSNNSTNPKLIPGFANGSGAYSTLADFKPSANYSGGVLVPVYFDALGIVWNNPPDLGAVQH